MPSALRGHAAARSLKMPLGTRSSPENSGSYSPPKESSVTEGVLLGTESPPNPHARLPGDDRGKPYPVMERLFSGEFREPSRKDLEMKCQWLPHNSSTTPELKTNKSHPQQSLWSAFQPFQPSDNSHVLSHIWRKLLAQKRQASWNTSNK